MTSAMVTLLIIPQTCILSLCKAIRSMKDVGVFISLKTVGDSLLEVSVVDYFKSSTLYVHIPIVKRPSLDVAWVNVASHELAELASRLTGYNNAVKLTITECQHALFSDAITLEPLLSQRTPTNALEPNQIITIHDRNAYRFVSLISLDILDILTQLSIGSAVIEVSLWSGGMIKFVSNHEHGMTLVEKQLTGIVCTSEEEKEEEDHDNNNENVEEKTHGSEKPVYRSRFVIKFVKHIVNSLVNSQKNQKSCLLGIPRRNGPNPLVLQFFLSKNICEFFQMTPYKPALPHYNVPGSHQNSIELTIAIPLTQQQQQDQQQQPEKIAHTLHNNETKRKSQVIDTLKNKRQTTKLK